LAVWSCGSTVEAGHLTAPAGAAGLHVLHRLNGLVVAALAVVVGHDACAALRVAMPGWAEKTR